MTDRWRRHTIVLCAARLPNWGMSPVLPGKQGKPGCQVVALLLGTRPRLAGLRGSCVQSLQTADPPPPSLAHSHQEHVHPLMTAYTLTTHDEASTIESAPKIGTSANLVPRANGSVCHVPHHTFQYRYTAAVETHTNGEPHVAHEKQRPEKEHARRRRCILLSGAGLDEPRAVNPPSACSWDRSI